MQSCVAYTEHLAVFALVKLLTCKSSCCRIFIGQASGKANGVGMKQAEQKKVLTDFRSGAFNTLVATCIGEEGLDIPQVQLHNSLDSLGHLSHQYKA